MNHAHTLFLAIFIQSNINLTWQATSLRVSGKVLDLVKRCRWVCDQVDLFHLQYDYETIVLLFYNESGIAKHLEII